MTDLSKTVLLNNKTEFKNFRTLQTIDVEHPSLQDKAPITISREVLRCASVGLMVIYYPEQDSILLSQQFRIGAFLSNDKNPFLLECAGGMVDEGENPKETAIRESFEETGATVHDVEKIGMFYASPGCSDEQFHAFCGYIKDVPTSNFHGMADEGEEIKTQLIPVSEIFEMMDRNEITNTATAISLLWFRLNHDRLKAKWST